MSLNNAWVLVAVATTACASVLSPRESDRAPSNDEYGAAEEVPEGPAARCVEADGTDVGCYTDDECCPGFYCGRDPQGSPVNKICMFGG